MVVWQVAITDADDDAAETQYVAWLHRQYQALQAKLLALLQRPTPATVQVSSQGLCWVLSVWDMFHVMKWIVIDLCTEQQ